MIMSNNSCLYEKYDEKYKKSMANMGIIHASQINNEDV